MNAFSFAHLEDDEPLREVLDSSIYVEPKDRDPADEDARQIRLINKLKRDHTHIAFHAVPNGGRQSEWAKIRGEKMGVVAGQPDLGFDWDGGNAVIEMKNGTEMPRPNQVARLNRLHRMGKNVAVCRTAEGALAWLASVGAPVGKGRI